MRRFAADLHVHTAHSPCAADEMTPPAIVARALEAGLAMIAICDHNTAANAAAAQEAAGGRLAVLPGIEITTREEIHVLGLFADAAAACALSARVRATLPLRAREDRRLLATGCGLDLAQAIALVHEHGGLAVASHVDRPSYGVIAQLGLFPRDAAFDAVEISAAGARRNAERGVQEAEWQRRSGIPATLPLVCGSDAHSLDELGAGRTWLEAEEATFGELRLALRATGGRRCGCA